MKARLGELSQALYGAIYSLTPRQRASALRALDGLTAANCGWTLYAMRDVLRGFIRDATPPKLTRKGKPR